MGLYNKFGSGSYRRPLATGMASCAWSAPSSVVPGANVITPPFSGAWGCPRFSSCGKANEAMFRANPALIVKAVDRLAEATMRLAEATHFERLARPGDLAAWAKAEKKRRGMVRLYESAPGLSRLSRGGRCPAPETGLRAPTMTRGG
jgi:hypothetical protein